MSDLYDNFREACASRGKTLTEVLTAIGRSTSATGTWKSGKSPRLDIAMELAEYLNMSLDELCFTKAGMRASILTDEERDWLEILSRIPESKKEICRAFLETHMVVPEKYVNTQKA